MGKKLGKRRDVRYEGTSMELEVGAVSSRFVFSCMQGRKQVNETLHASVMQVNGILHASIIH